MSGQDVKIVHKVSNKKSTGHEFILSDATPDRYGDVIMPDGWDLKNFNKNPIALFGHRSDFPIGRWKNLQVTDGALRGHLVMAPEGTSDRIDELRKLIAAGILKAVSVGFRPIESEPLSGGTKYIKSELVETSLVSVPANPNALMTCKALGVSRQTLKMVFNNINMRTHVSVKNNATISERIALAKARVATAAKLKELIPEPEPGVITWRGQKIGSNTFNGQDVQLPKNKWGW
jgi:HK97 family phage prohead protease